MRYFIQLSYNGTPYHGWQRQPNAVTVQQSIEEALSTIVRTPITIMGAGRTDTGVHASMMYAHVNLVNTKDTTVYTCLLYTSPSPRDQRGSRMPSSA